MGYYMTQRETKFKFKDGKDEEILNAIKDAVNKGNVTSWVDEITVNNSDIFQDALAECRWEYYKDDLWFEGEKLGSDYELFCAVAPFVEDGSYIEMSGEDGCLWRWVFENGKCMEVYPTITW